jgi:hypothetical protein
MNSIFYAEKIHDIRYVTQHHFDVCRATKVPMTSKFVKNVRELREFLQILKINN